MHCNYQNVHFIKVSTIIDCMNALDSIEIRKVQALRGERSFTLVFPKEFALELDIGKGDFLKCSLDGKRLIVEKMQT
jgi:hypothetical protein